MHISHGSFYISRVQYAQRFGGHVTLVGTPGFKPACLGG